MYECVDILKMAAACALLSLIYFFSSFVFRKQKRKAFYHYLIFIFIVFLMVNVFSVFSSKKDTDGIMVYSLGLFSFLISTIFMIAYFFKQMQSVGAKRLAIIMFFFLLIISFANLLHAIRLNS